MNTIILNKTKINQKDIQKGQKIVAAMYLVTKHLSDSDPLKDALRSLCVSFVGSTFAEHEALLAHIEMLLGGAVISGLISEKNSSIIIYEAKHFFRGIDADETTDSLHTLFQKEEGVQTYKQTDQRDAKKTYTPVSGPSSKGHNPDVSYIRESSKNFLNKNSRQEKIVSFLRERKSAVIKDITTLFPEVSEKTIQRELNTLIEDGRITKRGSKRWSMYMARE